MVKLINKPGAEWELVRWAQDVSASSIGGAKAIPALTAIRKKGDSLEILHGHAAVRARKHNPRDWEMFAYPEMAFVNEGRKKLLRVQTNRIECILTFRKGHEVDKVDAIERYLLIGNFRQMAGFCENVPLRFTKFSG